MKITNKTTVEELLIATEKNGGAMPIIDKTKTVWLIERMSRQSSNLTASQLCVHEWEYSDFKHDLNCYLARHCAKCNLFQRWVTSTGEWTNAKKQ